MARFILQFVQIAKRILLQTLLFYFTHLSDLFQIFIVFYKTLDNFKQALAQFC